MFAGIIFWGLNPVVVPMEWFDERSLPTVTLQDLDEGRFHDAIAANRCGAKAWMIRRWIEHLQSKAWDTAGFLHEYEQELRRLRWALECWLRLEGALDTSWGEEYRAGKLKELRMLLGPSMYYAGQMPDYPAEAILRVNRQP